MIFAYNSLWKSSFGVLSAVGLIVRYMLMGHSWLYLFQATFGDFDDNANMKFSKNDSRLSSEDQSSLFKHVKNSMQKRFSSQSTPKSKKVYFVNEKERIDMIENARTERTVVSDVNEKESFGSSCGIPERVDLIAEKSDKFSF